MAHGLGTARVASCFSLIAAFIVWLVTVTHDGFVWTPWVLWASLASLLLGIVVVGLFHDGYRRVGINTQGLYDKMLEKAIEDEKKG